MKRTNVWASLLVVALGGSPVATALAATELVAEWRFESSAELMADSSGNGHTLTGIVSRSADTRSGHRQPGQRLLQRFQLPKNRGAAESLAVRR